MNKKLVVDVVALVLLMLGALGSGYAQSESHAACNNRLIAGNYGFTIQGNKLGGQGPTGPQVGVAMTEFDGKGGLTQIDTVTVSGEVVADFTHTPATWHLHGEFRLHRHIHNQLHRRPATGRRKLRCGGKWFGDRHRRGQCGWNPGDNRDQQRREKAVLQTLTPRLADRGQRDHPIKKTMNRGFRSDLARPRNSQRGVSTPGENQVNTTENPTKKAMGTAYSCKREEQGIFTNFAGTIDGTLRSGRVVSSGTHSKD